MAAEDTVSQAVEPILKSVDSAVTSGITTPGVFTEIALGIAFLVVIIGVHGWCLGAISKQFNRQWRMFNAHTSAFRVRFVLGSTIALLALTHFFETWLWTIPAYGLGVIPNLRDAYYYVLEAYTTLGESTVTLPDTWRLAGPIIAISGLFTFSWTGSVLVYVMTQSSRRQLHPGLAAPPPTADKPAPAAASPAAPPTAE